jgi:hypothetical protein
MLFYQHIIYYFIFTILLLLLLLLIQINENAHKTLQKGQIQNRCQNKWN